MRWTLFAGAALALLAGARTARANDLTLHTIEYGSWPSAVAALQGNLGAEGRSVGVFVRDDAGRSLPCGAYHLALDTVGSSAFAIGQCDPSTGATAVRLVRRAALFGPADPVPVPLAVGLTARQVRTGGARGGAASVGGSDATCSVAVRPYMTDLLHGTRVYLQPGRFALRSVAAGVGVEPAGATGWLLRSAPRAGLAVEYEVVDTLQAGRVVVHDRATLTCATETLARGADAPALAAAAVTAPEQGPQLAAAPRAGELADYALRPGTVVPAGMGSCAAPIPLRPDAAVTGTTRGGAARPVFVVHSDVSDQLALDLQSEFGGEVLLYPYCPDPSLVAAAPASDVFGGGPEPVRLRWSVPPGTWYVVLVDADVHQHAGRYTVRLNSGLGFDL